MLDFKEEIAKSICKVVNMDKSIIKDYIETPPDFKMGDYAFPCFKLAKELRKAPQIISNEIKEQIEIDASICNNIEVAGGYINFFLNKETFINSVLIKFSNSEENYGASNIGNGKKVIVEYSSPNIAKQFHIGHLRTTVIGQALYNIYKYLGYEVISINHLGDYGTQFGKLIEAYKRWGQEYNMDENPIEELTKLYVRITNLCKEDETVLELCRENFKKLEEKDEYCVSLWEKFREVSLKEFQKVYDMLGIKFDSINGEAFYSDKMEEVIHKLDDSGKLKTSNGAKIIDLEDKGIETPCIIEKSNGSTTYATRDLAAILYRARTYDYDKLIYVVAYEQILHFRQVFEVAKLLGLDEKYTNGLVHVPFGMVQLKTGKMSTREGNVIKLENLLKESILRVRQIIETKNPEMEGKEEISRIIGIGAVIFHDLANNRIKDEIFDWDTVLNFNGETGPYIQYIYVRTKSVLEKANYIPNIDRVKTENLKDDSSISIIKLISEFGRIIQIAGEKNEPSIIAKFLIDLAHSYSSFYNENKILGENEDIQEARLYLTYVTGCILKQGMKLLGIDMPSKM